MKGVHGNRIFDLGQRRHRGRRRRRRRRAGNGRFALHAGGGGRTPATWTRRTAR